MGLPRRTQKLLVLRPLATRRQSPSRHAETGERLPDTNDETREKEGHSWSVPVRRPRLDPRVSVGVGCTGDTTRRGTPVGV